MCGFIGSLGNDGLDEEILKKMTLSLNHRGPDSNAYWLDKESNFSFGHTRLSIQDTSEKGAQPMHSFTGRYVISFNGEIYNHLSLRSEIEEDIQMRGMKWSSRSDTETILSLVEVIGIPKTLSKLNGMFSFALWDKKEKKLTLARDRIGEKPLYYGWQKNNFVFGSELKAIKINPNFENKLNYKAISMFMRYSYIPEPESIYDGINKLIPGTYISINSNTKNIYPEPIKYWSLIDSILKKEKIVAKSKQEVLREFEDKLETIIDNQQISDVPVGAFLSGGVDSSLIVSLMQKMNSKPINTFTIGSEEMKNDESINARLIAKHLGTNHNEIIINSNDTLKIVPLITKIYDEPFADSSQIPTYLVSSLASSKVKVCLSGDGGDELFGGYNRYLWSRRLKLTPDFVKKQLLYLLRLISSNKAANIYNKIERFIPSSLRFSLVEEKFEKLNKVLSSKSDIDLFKSIISVTNSTDRLMVKDLSYDNISNKWNSLGDLQNLESRMMALDALTYLPGDILCKVDRASMYHSLEIRSPYLDHQLIEYAFNLDNKFKFKNGVGKWISRELLKKYVPLNYLSSTKKGFSTPIDIWLRGPLKKWAEDLISKEMILKHGILNYDNVQSMWQNHQNGNANKNKELWNILILQSWLEKEQNS